MHLVCPGSFINTHNLIFKEARWAFQRMLACEHLFLSTVVLSGKVGPLPASKLLQGSHTVDATRQGRRHELHGDL